MNSGCILFNWYCCTWISCIPWWARYYWCRVISSSKRKSCLVSNTCVGVSRGIIKGGSCYLDIVFSRGIKITRGINSNLRAAWARNFGASDINCLYNGIICRLINDDISTFPIYSFWEVENNITIYSNIYCAIAWRIVT